MAPMNPLNETLETMFATRFTCKRYDPDRTVTDEDMHTICEAARMSPSSFGFEPWKFLVIAKTSPLAEPLRERAWGMKRNAPYTIVILARKHMEADSAHVTHMMTDVQHLSPEDAQARREAFAAFQKRDIGIADDPRLMFEWSCRQCYIALADMLATCALLHIDATPVEGLNYDEVNAFLVEKGLMDPEEFGVAVMMQVGYRDPSHRMSPKTRQAPSEVFTFLD
ncbi:MAG: NAD(P)H-dependent oxidoreductase [Slackia sp.]|nr:NAD(P)H-dependent oxidoreductase [Slackia sp.]